MSVSAVTNNSGSTNGEKVFAKQEEQDQLYAKKSGVGRPRTDLSKCETYEGFGDETNNAL